jgi:hypothetical protein
MKSVNQKYHEEIQPEGTGEEFKRDTNLSRADSRLEGRFPSMKKRILLRTPTAPIRSSCGSMKPDENSVLFEKENVVVVFMFG